MAKKSLPSPELLRKLLDYDPETGLLTWKPRPDRASWNSRLAGKPALNHVNEQGYKTGILNARKYRAHRIIWKLVTGEEPPSVDHINGDPSDNRLANLRSASLSQNQRNAKLRKDNSSGHMGVSRIRSSGMWIAQIRHNNKKINLGRFTRLEDAVKARNEAEKRYLYHPNHGRS